MECRPSGSAIALSIEIQLADLGLLPEVYHFDSHPANIPPLYTPYYQAALKIAERLNMQTRQDQVDYRSRLEKE